MNEIWLPAPGYADRYEVSSEGRIRSVDRIDGRGVQRRGQILDPGPSNGYRMVTPVFAGRKVGVYVHRLVAAAYVPNPLGLPQVNHKDGNKMNCHPSNLEWTDHQGNMHHARRTGLKRQKLNESDVRKIRSAREAGVPTHAVAHAMQITEEQVRNVFKRRQWAWLEDLAA